MHAHTLVGELLLSTRETIMAPREWRRFGSLDIHRSHILSFAEANKVEDEA